MWGSSSRKLRGMAGQQLVAGFLAGACFVTLLLLLTSEGCRGPGASVVEPLSQQPDSRRQPWPAAAAAATLSTAKLPLCRTPACVG